jgi:hypothetical protein
MTSSKPTPPNASPAIGNLINEAVDLLGRLHMDNQSEEERTLLMTAAEALLFIWHTGQTRAFQDYQKRRDADSPPPIVAAFATRDEAEVWLNHHAYPPHLANVLIADKYYTVADFTESKRRALLPQVSLEVHLHELRAEGLPPPTATFATLDEARSWWNAQTEPPEQTVIQVGDEPFLAANYRNIAYRALFPFSLANRWKP